MRLSTIHYPLFTKVALLFILSTIHYTLFTMLFAPPAYPDIKLKVAVVNPSETESQTTPVRYDLPKGMTPEMITDAGTMELKYDFDKNNYYFYQVVKLKPSEKVVLEAKLRDMWLVPDKDINFLKGGNELGLSCM